MVGNQIANLTPNLSFGHNLCFKCPNEQCKPSLDIYISIVFQWYEELFKVMSFDPCNYVVNIQKSFGTLTPNMGVPLGVWGFMPSHSLQSREHVKWLPGVLSWPATLQPPCFVHEPKARVVTRIIILFDWWMELSQCFIGHKNSHPKFHERENHSQFSLAHEGWRGHWLEGRISKLPLDKENKLK